MKPTNSHLHFQFQKSFIIIKNIFKRFSEINYLSAIRERYKALYQRSVTLSPIIRIGSHRHKDKKNTIH